MIRQLQRHPPGPLQGGPLLVPADGGVDAQQAGVGVVGHVGVHRVAQPPLLPQLLEQPGGAAAPQQGVEEQNLGPPLVQIAGGGEGQDQMVLLDGLLLGGDGGAVGHRGTLGGQAGGQGGEQVPQAVRLGRGELPGQGGHQVARVVVLPLPPGQPLPGHPLQGGLPAQDGPGQGGAPVDGGGQPLAHQVLGGVLVHADLLQDDPPLQLHVPLVEPGVEQHIGQNVQPLVQVPVQGAAVEAGVLLGGVGVELPADGVHVPGQLARRAAGGPLEQHVLDEVGGPVLPGGLVAGAHPHEEAQGGGLGPGHLLEEQPGPVGQGDRLIHSGLLKHSD